MRHNKLLNNLWDSRCNLSNLILLTMALTSTSAFGQAQNVNVIPFKTNHQNTQYYEINLSDAPSTNNVIFFINGSGCQNIKNKLYDYFKPIHNKFDGVLYSLQKIGVNQDNNDNTCSNEFIENDFFDGVVKEQNLFIKSMLSALPIKPKHVVLIGASEGAEKAAKIANINNSITHLGLIGSGGDSLRNNLRLLSKGSFLFRNPDGKFKEIEANKESIDKTVWGHSYKYWSSILDVNVGDLVYSLNIPVVIAMGEKDKSVPIESLKNLKNNLENQDKENIEINIYPNADHKLIDQSLSKSYGSDFLNKLLDGLKK